MIIIRESNIILKIKYYALIYTVKNENKTIAGVPYRVFVLTVINDTS